MRWRAVLALAAGALAALAYAPLYLLPLLAFAYPALLLLIDGAREAPRPMRNAFFAGWLFGFAQFLLGLYWMAFAFFVQADEFGWMAPFAILGMAAFLALFWGAAAAATVRFATTGPKRLAGFAFCVMLVEYARGHVLTGLPWNLPGQALAGTAAGAQAAAIIGVYGLSLIAVTLACLPVAVIGRFWRGLGAAVVGAAILFAGGALRLGAPDAGVRDDIVVRVVQPNIPQREKIDWSLWGRNFARHIDLSDSPAPDGATLFIIWPENAASAVDEVAGAIDRLAEALPDGAILLTGSARREIGADAAERYYNSLAVIEGGRGGRRVAAFYDKHHLVPFGEYLPFKEALNAIGLAQLTPYGADGFTPGSGPRTFRAGGSAFAPLICYEAIFPGALYPREERPDWLVAVTNDAWFGDTSGPRQHLDQARLRAIETGLPIVRSANTGISALIDGKGRYVERIPLYEVGVFDAPLPKAEPKTIYARIGDVGFLFLMLGAGATGLSGRRREGRPSSQPLRAP